METRCPICGTTTGRITEHFYFCPECNIEFNPKTGRRYTLNAHGQRIRIEGVAPAKKQRVRPSKAEIVEKGYLQGLNYWRLKNGISWATLAEFTGYNASSLRKLADCERLPKAEVLEKLCSVLGVSAEALRTEYPQAEVDRLQAEIIAKGHAAASLRLKNGGYRNKAVYCVETRTIYPSLTTAAKELGISLVKVSRACRGESAKGYHFKYVE